MRNTFSGTLAVKALASGTVQTGTTNGVAIDTAVFNNNFRDVLFIIHSGTLTDGSYAVTVEESDSSGSGYAAVESWRVQGSLPTFASTDDNVWNSFGVRPTKRYVRIVVTATSATTGGVLAATAVLGNGGNNPAARA
ncbi:hypothetical protein EUA02_29935 [Mycobacterium paragordonae]|uniref:hypothetical protein n=1 Tax=Mycobacterium paragordonae TaxID=1389713 RepID=UPI00105C4462|nr:hypothetical protein [Mycobacterium paragordonae]TDK85480.1 hypothetical protein EUA02_29935 [Mycobacterium paragordonae]TDK98948.1 hypothetical protein EUA05_31050 [Mycobacterium paragordonae]